MLRKASFVSLVYITGGSEVEQGFRDGRRPGSAHSGGNGSFRVFFQPEYRLTVVDADGQSAQEDIYEILKLRISPKRLVKNLRNRIEEIMVKQEFIISGRKHLKIKNLDVVMDQVVQELSL